MFMVLETWVRRGGRDFERGGPMGVQETSAVEVIFDWRLEVDSLILHDWNGASYDKVPNIKYADGMPVTSCGELLYSYVTCSNNFVKGIFVVELTLHLNFANCGDPPGSHPGHQD
ncbi:hypothetical protein TNCV_964121 [Trichonephila clavipes]|nr:hypothetical protein TNCV_964121 [Trichonephila clavipes]